MGYAKELGNPWGLLLTACAVWVAAAIHLPVVATVLVGIAVLFGRAGVTVWLRTRPEP